MNKRAVILISSLAAVVIAVVLACSIFAVGEVRVVTGADVALDEETQKGIVAAAGVKEGSSIFSLDEQAVTANVEAAFPEVKVITIERGFPGTVSVNCALRTPFIYVACEGGYALLDRELKVIKIVSSAPGEGYMFAGGYTLSSAQAGAFAEIPWLKALVAGGESNYFMNQRLAYLLPSVTYHGGENAYLDMLTNTGAHLIVYDEGDIAHMFSLVYAAYKGCLFGESENSPSAYSQSGWFYPQAESGRVNIKYSQTAPFA